VERCVLQWSAFTPLASSLLKRGRQHSKRGFSSEQRSWTRRGEAGETRRGTSALPSLTCVFDRPSSCAPAFASFFRPSAARRAKRNATAHALSDEKMVRTCSPPCVLSDGAVYSVASCLWAAKSRSKRSKEAARRPLLSPAQGEQGTPQHTPQRAIRQSPAQTQPDRRPARQVMTSALREVCSCVVGDLLSLTYRLHCSSAFFCHTERMHGTHVFLCSLTMVTAAVVCGWMSSGALSCSASVPPLPFPAIFLPSLLRFPWP
jgi:hypothetical protein